MLSCKTPPQHLPGLYGELQWAAEQQTLGQNLLKRPCASKWQVRQHFKNRPPPFTSFSLTLALSVSLYVYLSHSLFISYTHLHTQLTNCKEETTNVCVFSQPVSMFSAVPPSQDCQRACNRELEVGEERVCFLMEVSVWEGEVK